MAGDAVTTFEDGPLHIDFDCRTVTFGANPVTGLTSGEFDLLVRLVKHRGKPLAYDQIAELAWDEGGDPTNKASKYSMIRLRRKLGWDDDADDSPFEHVAGVGYQYRSPRSETCRAARSRWDPSWCPRTGSGSYSAPD